MVIRTLYSVYMAAAGRLSPSIAALAFRDRTNRMVSLQDFRVQSINFIDERVKNTDIVSKINTNYATIKQIQQ